MMSRHHTTGLVPGFPVRSWTRYLRCLLYRTPPPETPVGQKEKILFRPVRSRHVHSTISPVSVRS